MWPWRLEIYYPSVDGTLVHPRASPQHKFASTHILSYLEKHSSHVSGLSIYIFVTLWLCGFVALCVRMRVAGVNKVEGTMS